MSKKEDKGDTLYDDMTKLKGKTDETSKAKMQEVVEKLADEAKKNFDTVKAEVDNMKPNENGMNPKKLWRLKKKLCPNSRPPPTAMLDSRGNLLTTDRAIEERALEVFENRLEGNEIEDSLKNLEADTSKETEGNTESGEVDKGQKFPEDADEVFKHAGDEIGRYLAEYIAASFKANMERKYRGFLRIL